MEALESCRRKLSHGIGVYKIAALIAVVAIVAAALFVIRLNRREITSASGRNVAPSASALTPLPEKSIAVLPLENLSPDPDNVYFAEGMQDEILSPAVQDCGPESDLTHFHPEIQKRTRQSARDRETTRGWKCSGGQRAKER